MSILISARPLRLRLTAVAVLLGATACGSEAAAPPESEAAPTTLTMPAGLDLADRFRVEAIAERRFNHATYWAAVEPSLASPVFRTEEIGRSVQGRAIRAVTYGTGPTTVLLWSQMHGDEATASMALADIFRFLAEAEGDSLRERLRTQLTMAVIPVLNPDGAELFQRENAWGIDINRDARRLSTPEGQALKGFRDRFNPQFGFNLHDQNARSRVGSKGHQAAIALLAPPFDADRSYNDVRSRARLVAATLAKTFEADIPGRVAKYDDGFNPRAFGDLMQQWGTSTVLIESGALPNDPDKQRLRALHVAGILAALDAIATGGYARASAAWYDDLPFNASGANDLLVLGGKIVLPGGSPFVADLAINFDDAVARTGGRIREVGDLQMAVAIDTVDATGLFLHPADRALRAAPQGGTYWLRIGAPAEIAVRRGAEASSPLVRQIEGPPDGR